MQLSKEHQLALQWFRDRAGEVLRWPEPLEGLFLVNRAKGIHKPEGWEHALSVRLSMTSPYQDEITENPSRGWKLTYAYEGTSPTHFTNRALRKCMVDGVPVGVLVQVEGRPQSRYRVLGVGLVEEDDAVACKFKIASID